MPGFQGKNLSQEECYKIFETYLLPMQDEVYSYILTSVKDPEKAQDILQSVYEGAWKSLPRLKKRNSLKNWFYRIIRNKIADYYKECIKLHEDSLKKEVNLTINPGDYRDALEILIEEENLQLIWSLLDELGEPTAGMMRLWYLNEWSLKEVAAYLSMNYNSVRSIVNRGVKKWRTLYEERKGGDPNEAEKKN